jgi:23S rRNA (pseudouridine1915-N3)-methyltransferase
MMRIVVVQSGKIRDDNIIALRDEFVKRFKRFGSLNVIEKDAKGGKPLWPGSSRWKVLLDEHGVTMPSEQFAKQLQKWTMQHGEVAFAVGDAYGHSPSTRSAANFSFSLGEMTMPHQLAHVVLIEQIYRAGTILAGLPYHHA